METLVAELEEVQRESRDSFDVIQSRGSANVSNNERLTKNGRNCPKMTKIDHAGNGSAGSTSIEASGKRKRRDQMPTLRLRVSIGADDVGLLPLYNALLELPSDKARRLHVRQILLQSVTVVPVPRHATQAPVLSPGFAMPAATQLKEIAAGVEASRVEATPRAGKAEIFKKLGMFD